MAGVARLTEAQTSRSVSTPAGDIRYHEAGSGSPLVLIHGSGPGTTGWTNFRHNIEPLAEHFRVLAPDMPGWGESYRTPYDARHQVDAVAGLLDALQIERAALVGTSLGGMTSLQFLVDRPERVSGVVTIGASAPGADIFASRDGAAAAGAAFLAAFATPSAETIRTFSATMLHDQALVTDELIDDRLARIAAAPETLGAFLQGMGRASALPPAFPNFAADLQRSSVPVLAIHGRDDRLVHFESALRLATMIPDARMLLLGQCGHWAQVEKALEVNQAVIAFVRQIGGADGAQ